MIKKPWEVTSYNVRANDPILFIDIIPLDDDKEHYMGDECHCKPEIKRENGVPIITHNAYDKREKAEVPPLC